MRRLFTCFECAGPGLTLAYWMSLWWIAVALFLDLGLFGIGWNLADLLAVDRGFDLSSGVLVPPAGPSWIDPRRLLEGALAGAFLWLVLVATYVARAEARAKGTGSLDFPGLEAQRKGLRWILGIAVLAAWLIPIGIGAAYVFLL